MQQVGELCGRIKAVHNRGDFLRAAELAGDALNDSPDDARLWELHGLAYHGMRDFPRAMNSLERASLLAPLTMSAQVALAGCYLVTDRRDLALCMYEFLVTQMDRLPTSLLPLVSAGLSRLDKNRLGLEVHRERVRRSPEGGDAFFCVAPYMRLLNYPPEVILPVAQEAFRLDPHRVRNRVAVAMLHYRCGNVDKAYGLVTVVSTSRLLEGCCPCRLKSLAALFAAAGDAVRRDACEARLADALESESGGPPRRCSDV
jgi:tetratricopeptide (TPR) repeat protein